MLSRDSTFKFMTHVWKRAMRGIHITADETGMIVDEVSVPKCLSLSLFVLIVS